MMLIVIRIGSELPIPGVKGSVFQSWLNSKSADGLGSVSYTHLDVYKRQGRNNQGKITVRHQSGGNRRKYRLIDFKRNKKDGIPATVILLNSAACKKILILRS